MSKRLTGPQAALLRKARDSRYGATATGAGRKTLDKLKELELVAFVPWEENKPGERGHVWRPTAAGLAALAELEQAGR